MCHIGFILVGYDVNEAVCLAEITAKAQCCLVMNEGVCTLKFRKEKQISVVVAPQHSTLNSFNVLWSGHGEV